MTRPANETHTKERTAENDEVAVEIVQGFIDRKKAEGEALAKRKQHAAEAARRVTAFWDQYDMDDINERVNEFQEKAGSGFRTLHQGYGGFMPGEYQYPFIEVAPGVKMTLRELTKGEERRGSRDGGEVVAVRLVVQADGLPGSTEQAREADDTPGEATYATVYGPASDNLIEYADSTIDADPVQAEMADREVLAQVQAVQEGLLGLLGNPQPAA